ncbi:ATPase (AAA+ superfamily) [Micractinium conductrix]|uniref:ATPase (AAA+ superfamily) n=1 Tax=Micractinium conductrix TaxID=554055 RepID=A0A2P6VAJ9_9CHLO|nr:ATPase (AAA+ superfamily) [Micractinium conductrix]|eukprot:PSC71126.1 ATPase (AAA+ superfamily) [Micractinium conductrix]
MAAVVGQAGHFRAEKHAEELTRAAASLLLYSGVLKGKAAQSFLGVLQLLQKGNPLALVQSYGELYRSLAADEAPSWGDHLLNEVIRGTESPLARAAATGKPTAHLRAAAGHDLDLLQQLAVLEHTLATWVKDSAYGTTDRWLEAASCVAAVVGGGGGDSDGGSGAAGGAADPVLEALLSGQGPPAGLLAPLSEARRAALRAELAGKWRWSEGLELLERYHAAHGYGLVGSHRVLTWSGKLQAQDALTGVHELDEELLPVPRDDPALKGVLQALAEFVEADPRSGRRPHHIAILKFPSATRWLLAVWALQVGVVQEVAEELRPQAEGLRVVVLPSSQLGSLPELAWSLSQHPRARWVVLANGLSSLSAQGVADLAAMMSGYDGFSWPSNALLVGGFSDAVPEELKGTFR